MPVSVENLCLPGGTPLLSAAIRFISFRICSFVMSSGTIRDSSTSLGMTRSALISWHFVWSAQVFPPLQRDWHVAILPDEIVERAQVEFFALPQAGFGQESHDLKFADLISDGLAGAG